jgi:hypothetical protein
MWGISFNRNKNKLTFPLAFHHTLIYIISINKTDGVNNENL